MLNMLGRLGDLLVVVVWAACSLVESWSRPNGLLVGGVLELS